MPQRGTETALSSSISSFTAKSLATARSLSELAPACHGLAQLDPNGDPVPLHHTRIMQLNHADNVSSALELVTDVSRHAELLFDRMLQEIDTAPLIQVLGRQGLDVKSEEDLRTLLKAPLSFPMMVCASLVERNPSIHNARIQEVIDAVNERMPEIIEGTPNLQLAQLLEIKGTGISAASLVNAESFKLIDAEPYRVEFTGQLADSTPAGKLSREVYEAIATEEMNAWTAKLFVDFVLPNLGKLHDFPVSAGGVEAS